MEISRDGDLSRLTLDLPEENQNESFLKNFKKHLRETKKSSTFAPASRETQCESNETKNKKKRS
jgi:hypothetical protein